MTIVPSEAPDMEQQLVQLLSQIHSAAPRSADAEETIGKLAACPRLRRE